MASSRYSRRPAGKPAPKPEPEPEAEAEPQAEADDVSVELPEEAGTFAEEAYSPDEAPAAPAPRAASSARNRGASSARNSGVSGRSSRRMSATSDKKSSRRPSLTPEEAKARRRALLSAFKLALGLIILVGGVFAVCWFVIRDDKPIQQARAVLNDIDTVNIKSIDTALDHQRPEDAEKWLVEARKKIEDTPEFSNQKSPPDLLAAVAAKKEDLAQREQRIARVKRDVRVSNNLDSLLAQFVKINQPETDLDKLEADAKAFLDNPVEWPNGSHNEDYIKTYSTEVNRIQTRMASIESQRNQRKVDETTTPVEHARETAKGLAAQEKYHEALAMIDDYAAKNPKADFSQVRSWIEDEAQKHWVATKSVVENLYKDVDAIGSSAATKKEALEQARAKLKSVIDNYGIDQYVSEAKALYAKYPQ
jgi:hypothetical protein